MTDQMQHNRLFIVGAGFSVGAGIPLTKPLLQKTMEMFQAECSGLYQRMTWHILTSHETDNIETCLANPHFSKLCTFLDYLELKEYGGGERWCDQGSKEKLAFKFYLSKTIVANTPLKDHIPSLYLEFARQLHKGDIILSFNWDMLMENAIKAVGKTYSYNFSQDGIWLCKMHGSINWRLSEPVTNTLYWKAMGFRNPLITKEIYYSEAMSNIETWYHYKPLLSEIEPLLVLPGYGKAYDVRNLAPLWYQPEYAFASTKDVFIIGLSLSDDDYFIKSFFVNSLPGLAGDQQGRKIIIINPNKEVANNYRFVLGYKNAVWKKEKFSAKHLELM